MKFVRAFVRVWARILPRLCLAAVLAGGASAGWSPAPAAAGQAAEDEGGGLMDWFGDERAQFYRLAPLNVPVIRDGRIVQQVSLAIALETPDRRMRNKVVENRALLHSAFLRDLHAVLSLHASNKGLKLDTVKIRLKRIADRVLGHGVARDILVESAYVRQID